MKYQILITVFIMKTTCHVPKNNSDVIVTYSGHAEAVMDDKPKTPKEIQINDTSTNVASVPELKIVPTVRTTTPSEPIEEYTEDVLFVPNHQVSANDDDFLEDTIDSVVNRKTIGDIMNNPEIRVETEPPLQDIFFISGKNNENENLNSEPKKERKEPTRRSGKKIEKLDILDCNHLNCNNTLKSLCGRKIDQSKYKYRLFLNECYYRKVNCGFKYKENRYIAVPLELCNTVGAHYTEIPIVFKPHPLPNVKKNLETRRVDFSSRRSLSVGPDGKFCSHPCPITCPEDYDPQCAVSATGQKRVFANHCKLDLNSCSYRVAWYHRPLAQCVGGKKADMTQNKGFISWMQRVGIVDKRGRLVLT